MERKLDIGNVFDRTFNYYGQQAGLILPAAFLVFLPAAIIDGVIRSGKATILLALLSTAVGLIATFWFQGMVVQAVSDIQDGRRDLSLGRLFESAAPFVPALIGAGILAGFGVAIGLILLIVPGLFLLTIWALLSPVIVMERSGVFGAFGRSRELVRGNGWQVFGVIVLIFLLNLIASILLIALVGGIADNVAGYGAATLIADVLIGPISGIATAVMYFELRAMSTPPPAPGAAPAEPPPPAG